MRTPRRASSTWRSPSPPPGGGGPPPPMSSTPARSTCCSRAEGWRQPVRSDSLTAVDAVTGKSTHLVPVQPGGRPPAPGELVLLQAFLNSHYDLEGDHGAELLATPAAARQWLVSHQLLDRAAELDEPARGRLLALREALRD